MIQKKLILQWVEEFLRETELFPVEILIKPGNKILVFIDGDHGVKIADCIALSKNIESKLDRDAEDFELNVSSSGIDKPFVLLRQYRKNIGREIEVTLISGNIIKGKLLNVSGETIEIEKKLSPKNKKNETEVTQLIRLDEINQTRCVISFN